MSDIAIRTENLGKLYRIGQQERYLALQDILARSLSAPFRALTTILNGRRSAVEITEPTEGYAEIHGRVGSLLEVGTGFHSELTGRESHLLNSRGIYIEGLPGYQCVQQAI